MSQVHCFINDQAAALTIDARIQMRCETGILEPGSLILPTIEEKTTSAFAFGATYSSYAYEGGLMAPFDAC